MLKRVLLVLVLSLWANAASAECSYNGVGYPEGTVLGPYVCSNGQWVPR